MEASWKYCLPNSSQVHGPLDKARECLGCSRLLFTIGFLAFLQHQAGTSVWLLLHCFHSRGLEDSADLHSGSLSDAHVYLSRLVHVFCTLTPCWYPIGYSYQHFSLPENGHSARPSVLRSLHLMAGLFRQPQLPCNRLKTTQ